MEKSELQACHFTLEKTHYNTLQKSNTHIILMPCVILHSKLGIKAYH